MANSSSPSLEKNNNLYRKEISYFDGVNTSVGRSLFKLQEFSHLENARSETIGTVEKRKGTKVVGSALVATKNLGLFSFKDDARETNDLYRVSTVDGKTALYYLDDNAVWTKFTGVGANFFLLGDSTTTFTITGNNTAMTYTYTSVGTDPLITDKVAVGSTLTIAGQNFSSGNNGTFVVYEVGDDYFKLFNASGVDEANKTLGTGSISVQSGAFSACATNRKILLVNGRTPNLEFDKGGTTITTAGDPDSDFYLSPVANKINFYKNRIYLADYLDPDGVRRNGNSVMMSSAPMGVIALINEDYTAGVTEIKVTDTKYIHSSDTLVVFRGNLQIETLTITAKSEDSITVSATAHALQSADELWVENTFTGRRAFRWAGVPSSGENVKEYDTFTVVGGQNGRIKMLTNVGDVMMIGSNDNLAVWNDSVLQSLDNGVGCVSDRGYVKLFDNLFFLGYDGIYQTTGGTPQLISAKVQKYIEGATTSGLENACMGKKKFSIFCAIGDVTLTHEDGSAWKNLPDVVLERNVKTQDWFVHTGIPADQFSSFVQDSDPRALLYSASDTNCRIMEFLVDKVDDSGNDNLEIPFRVDTGDILLADKFEKYCLVHKIIVEAEQGAGMVCFISADKEAFYEVKGEVTKGCSILHPQGKNADDNTPIRCRTLNISVRDNSKQTCRISKIAILYEITAEEDQQDLT